MHNVFNSDKLYFVFFIFSCSIGLNIIMLVCCSSSTILLPLGDSGSHSGSISVDSGGAPVTFIFLRGFRVVVVVAVAVVAAASVLRNDADPPLDGYDDTIMYSTGVPEWDADAVCNGGTFFSLILRE